MLWGCFGLDRHHEALYDANGEEGMEGTKLADHFVWTLIERCRDSEVYEQQVGRSASSGSSISSSIIIRGGGGGGVSGGLVSTGGQT